MRYLAAILIILATACATDETNAPTMGHSDQLPTSDRDPATCTRACRVAMDLCTITSFEDKLLLSACSQQCDFTDDELACYAAATCGADADCPSAAATP